MSDPPVVFSRIYRARLVKRRRALESTPSRNNQPETHPMDGQGRRLSSRRSDHSDRFPNASPNSSRKVVAKRHPLDLAGWRKKLRSRIVYRPRSESRSKVDNPRIFVGSVIWCPLLRGTVCRFWISASMHQAFAKMYRIESVDSSIR